MNQDYRGRVDRFLKAGGDPKYVNVKRKAAARHEKEAQEAQEAHIKASMAKKMKKNKE